MEEAGARVQRNQRLADMGIPGISASGGRIVELVANDLLSSANPHGLPLVCDVTMGSPLRANGTARPRAHAEPGVAIADAEQDKTRRYAGADGVSVKFRSTVPPNEKRAAVRAALERMDAEEAAAFSLRQQLCLKL